MDLLRMTRRWLEARQRALAARRWRRAHLGAHSYLDPSVQVLGWRQVRIGHHTVIGEDSWLNVNARDSDEPGIVIGNNCFLGRRNFLNSGALLRLGDYCLTGVDCHFLGSDHAHENPFAPYVTTGSTMDGVIEVGANCWFGASVTVLKNVAIGFGSMIGAGAVVTRAVPPFSIAVGNPARVIKRFDGRRACWVPVAEWREEAQAALPTEAEYLAQLVQKHPAIKQPRLASGHRQGDL